MTGNSYFSRLTQRQQLNDLMHKYAQRKGLDYGSGWRELERLYFQIHGEKLSILKWKFEHIHRVKLTMPAFLEAQSMLQEIIAIGHNMTDGILKK